MLERVVTVAKINTKSAKIDQAVSKSVSGVFGKFFEHKVSWKAYPIAPITEDTYFFKRLLSVASQLEVPVGNLVLDYSEDTFTATKNALASNAKDELNHLEQLDYCIAAIEDDSVFFNEIDYIFDTLKNTCLGIETVTLAGLIELSCFFPVLGIMRKYGNSELVPVAGYISRDESAHVRTNLFLADQNKTVNKDVLDTFNEFRSEFMRVILEGWDHFEEWEANSKNLLYNRFSKELQFTEVPIYNAFFELRNY